MVAGNRTGQFNNLSWWNQLINETGKPVLLENCHQGGFDPGMVQWQGYIRNATTGAYVHELGYFAQGHDAAPPMVYASFCSACSA